MKWRLARLHKYGVMLMLTALIGAACGYVWHRSQPALKPGSNMTQQFGFYDLPQQQKELYDVRLSTVGETIVSYVSSPTNPHFRLKGSFVQRNQVGEKRIFTYTPVHFVPSPETPLLASNIDLLVHSQVRMQQLWPDGVPLVTMQNGMIFFYPLDDK